MCGLTMHQPFLLAALDQAWLGRGQCAPNPSVGAVAVLEGRIIAQDWHRGAGTWHAERLLIEQLSADVRPYVTLYVTLEPCNHWGKTPPCVDIIIASGIKRVVYAYRDPNPLVAVSHTPQLLAEKGIEVIHYPLAAIDAFYQSYHHWMVTKKPWVTVKMAQSLDGKIAGEGGERVSLSNALCADFTHKKRLHSDVLLTTARTVNRDDPLLNVRLSGIETARPLAIIDRTLQLRPDAKLWHTAKECHICHDASYRPIDAPGISYHAMPIVDGLLDLNAVILCLGQLGYHDVWVEAGSMLFATLHRLQLVNRTYVYLTPRVLGEHALSMYGESMVTDACAVNWQVMGDNVVLSLDWSSETLCLPG